MTKIAVFPGSFDPVTKGHENLIVRASSIFDRVIVAIGENSQKQTFFPIELKKQWLKIITEKLPNTDVQTFKGLTVNFCISNNAKYIIRGVRTSADFDYEKDIAQMNKIMHSDIETVFLLALPELSGITSSLVREIIKYGGNASPFLPDGVIIPDRFF